MKNTNNLDNKNENGINVALDKDDMGDYYDIGNDENEYEQVSELSSEENETSSEDEILPLHSGTDSESSCNDEDNEIGGAFNNDKVEKVTDSDIEEKEDGFPNVKAWGRNVKKFYNTNLIDIKTKFDNEEEELAKLEEIEARTIQQRLLGELEDVDLSLDLIVNVEKTKQLNEENELEEKSKIELDLTALHDVEKYELLKQTCPHLLTYIHDFKKLLNCINDELLSLRFHVMSKRSPVTEFVEIFHQLIMNYCTNVAFFFLIKSHKLDISLHPVMKWISTFEELLKESESIYDKAIKSQNQNGLKFSKKTLKRKRSITINFKPKTMKTTHDETVRKVADDKGQGQKLPHLYNELLESDGEEKESKRAINYQIAKNKGLTPHRKKELRNPRVKHRMKYRKAKIRRKGQVREARKEIQKYAGEISGIKATVVKSLKFKM